MVMGFIFGPQKMASTFFLEEKMARYIYYKDKKFTA